MYISYVFAVPSRHAHTLPALSTVVSVEARLSDRSSMSSNRPVMTRQRITPPAPPGGHGLPRAAGDLAGFRAWHDQQGPAVFYCDAAAVVSTYISLLQRKGLPLSGDEQLRRLLAHAVGVLEARIVTATVTPKGEKLPQPSIAPFTMPQSRSFLPRELCRLASTLARSGEIYGLDPDARLMRAIGSLLLPQWRRMLSADVPRALFAYHAFADAVGIRTATGGIVAPGGRTLVSTLARAAAAQSSHMSPLLVAETLHHLSGLAAAGATEASDPLLYRSLAMALARGLSVPDSSVPDQRGRDGDGADKSLISHSSLAKALVALAVGGRLRTDPLHVALGGIAGSGGCVSLGNAEVEGALTAATTLLLSGADARALTSIARAAAALGLEAAPAAAREEAGHTYRAAATKTGPRSAVAAPRRRGWNSAGGQSTPSLLPSTKSTSLWGAVESRSITLLPSFKPIDVAHLIAALARASSNCAAVAMAADAPRLEAIAEIDESLQMLWMARAAAPRTTTRSSTTPEEFHLPPHAVGSAALWQGLRTACMALAPQMSGHDVALALNGFATLALADSELCGVLASRAEALLLLPAQPHSNTSDGADDGAELAAAVVARILLAAAPSTNAAAVVAGHDAIAQPETDSAAAPREAESASLAVVTYFTQLAAQRIFNAVVGAQSAATNERALSATEFAAPAAVSAAAASLTSPPVAPLRSSRSPLSTAMHVHYAGAATLLDVVISCALQQEGLSDSPSEPASPARAAAAVAAHQLAVALAMHIASTSVPSDEGSALLHRRANGFIATRASSLHALRRAMTRAIETWAAVRSIGGVAEQISNSQSDLADAVALLTNDSLLERGKTDDSSDGPIRMLLGDALMRVQLELEQRSASLSAAMAMASDKTTVGRRADAATIVRQALPHA